jgi:hypothetical protein
MTKEFDLWSKGMQTFKKEKIFDRKFIIISLFGILLVCIFLVVFGLLLPNHLANKRKNKPSDIAISSFESSNDIIVDRTGMQKELFKENIAKLKTEYLGAIQEFEALNPLGLYSPPLAA